MPADIVQLLRQRALLEEASFVWREDWQDIADLMLPGQACWFPWQIRRRRERHLYDSTALWALDTFVAHLGAWVTNFQVQWFALSMKSLRENQEAAQWLDDVAGVQYESMVADDAAIPTAIHEAYRQYAGFGTGAVFLDEQPLDERGLSGFQGYQAQSLLIGTYGIAENAGGRVDTLYRDLEMTPHQAEQMWGRDALSPEMQQDLTAESVKRYTPVKFLHAIYPRRDRDRTRPETQEQMPWASCYLDVEHKHKVHEGGYRWFPGVIFRWEKIGALPWGFGRGHMALAESKTLQLIDRDALRALPMTILPPGWLVGESRETIGRVSLLPGAMNPLAKGGSFVPYQSGQRWDVAQMQIEERRNRILRAFFIDQLQFLPEPTQRTQRTLGELALRQRQMTRIMGPAFMRLLAEFLNPFIDITFSLLLFAGALPDPPQVVLDAAFADEGVINVEYLGPLARAQRDEEAETIAESLEFLVRLATELQDPLVLQNIAIDEAVQQFLRVRGFPDKLITDKRLLQEARAMAAQQMAQQNELAQGQQVAGIAKDAAPALQAIREFANGGATATA